VSTPPVINLPAATPQATVAECVQITDCGLCWQVPGPPCEPEGNHLARYNRGYRRGLVSAKQLAAVVEGLGPFVNEATLVPDQPSQPGEGR
jgi:hypothetical protein